MHEILESSDWQLGKARLRKSGQVGRHWAKSWKLIYWQVGQASLGKFRHMAGDGQNLGNYMLGSRARQVGANLGKWAGDGENLGQQIIGSWAGQVYGSLGEQGGDEQVGYVRDRIVINISAYHTEDRTQFPAM